MRKIFAKYLLLSLVVVDV